METKTIKKQKVMVNGKAIQNETLLVQIRDGIGNILEARRLILPPGASTRASAYTVIEDAQRGYKLADLFDSDL